MKTRGSSAKAKKLDSVSLDQVADSPLGESLCGFCYEFRMRLSGKESWLIERVQGEYERCKEGELPAPYARALSTLLTHGFTEEQIWQQIELQNVERLRFLREREENKGEGEDEEEEEDKEEDGEETEEEEVAGEELDEEKSDRFFNLAEMERFCDAAEADDFLQGDLDFDSAITGSDKIYYNDFFDGPEEDQPSSSKAGSSNRNGLEGNSDSATSNETDESESDDENQPKSSHQQRLQKLRERMGELEEENVKPKSWQMVGEVSGKERPANSLLEEHLGFQHGTKAPPTITMDFTQRLEAILIQRIKDKAWDDVERKVKPTIDPAKFRADLILDQEKSKVSLADVYEKEFLKQTQIQKEEESEENPRHVEIQRRMRELFRKLDALTNYHYAPKQPLPQLKVHFFRRSNLLIEEEVSERIEVVKKVGRLGVEDGVTADTAVSAQLLAPEEVAAPAPVDLKAKEEASETERLRERRRKKKRQREIALRKEAKATASNLGQNQSTVLAKIGKVKRPKLDASATAGQNFFNKLESKVRSEIAAKANLPQAPKPKKKSSSAAYKLA